MDPGVLTASLPVGFFGVSDQHVAKYGAALGPRQALVARVTQPAHFIGRQPSGVLVASLREAIRTGCVAEILPLLRPAQLVVFLDVERLTLRETTVLSMLDGVSVMAPSTPAEDFGDIVQLARRGMSCVPAALRRHLNTQTPQRLSCDEMALLMTLVRGGTCGAESAAAREHLYRRLGVKNADGALSWAKRHGLR